MSHDSEREYHLRRAREELDLAYHAECYAAMSAHMRLSAAHMAELRRLPAASPIAPAAEAVAA